MAATIQSGVWECLSQIRDPSFTSRATSKGALIQESYSVFQAVRNGLPVEDIRGSIREGKLLSKSAFETRRQIANAIHLRYLAVCPAWVGNALAESTGKGMQSSDFLSLLYLYYVLRDGLVFEFIVGPVWERWKQGGTNIDAGDFLSLLVDRSDDSPNIKKWREATRRKLASNFLSSLRDLGLFKGKSNKHIQLPSISDETVYHLLCVLIAEGKEGLGVLEAPDWRIFLWDEKDVSNAMNNLSQKQWVRFERGGRTVILELIRQPGIEE